MKISCNFVFIYLFVCVSLYVWVFCLVGYFFFFFFFYTVHATNHFITHLLSDILLIPYEILLQYIPFGIFKLCFIFKIKETSFVTEPRHDPLINKSNRQISVLCCAYCVSKMRSCSHRAFAYDHNYTVYVVYLVRFRTAQTS